MKLKILLFLLLSQIPISAQIDTTIWYPLQVGNSWEYVDYNPISIGRKTITIIGDTLMPNGKKYYIFDKVFVQNQKYLMMENNNLVYGYFTESCQNNEDLVYKFSVQDSSIWPACISFTGDGVSYYGISQTDYIYFPMFDKTLETKLYEYVRTDTVNTPGDTLWDGRIYDYITKGIGKTRIKIDQGGDWHLAGAIINGKTYGIITSINNKQDIPNKFTLKQNYPNPFNPSTNIKYSITKTGQVSLKVYDSLGKEVKTLFEGLKNTGTYTVKFNGSGLASGFYIYQLKTNGKIISKKMILLK